MNEALQSSLEKAAALRLRLEQLEGYADVCAEALRENLRSQLHLLEKRVLKLAEELKKREEDGDGPAEA